MEAYFQLNGCVSVGGWPRGAQVRRTLGVRLSALRRRRPGRLCAVGRLLDPRPVGLDPLVDGVLVTLGGATHRPLHRPAQPVAQQRPHVGRVVPDAGQPRDHSGDPLQGPQLPDKPVGRGALEQGLLVGDELGIR
jgi:hypothetical protein